jgi:endonuclease YncB( thermonuclease family)
MTKFKFCLLAIVLGISSKAMAFSIPNGPVKVAEVLQGDTGILISQDGKSSYFHLAGCDAPASGSSYFSESKNSLNAMTEVSLMDIIVLQEENGHMLVQMKSHGNDVCAEQIKRGLAFFKSDDKMRGVQEGIYKSLQNNAKLAKRGVWSKGDVVGRFTQTASSSRGLQEYKYKQKYINGATDPAQEGYDRPLSNPHNPSDWRTKIKR